MGEIDAENTYCAVGIDIRGVDCRRMHYRQGHQVYNLI